MKPNLPLTWEQSLIATAISETYGTIHFERYPSEEDPSVTIYVEFWGDSYSAYKLEITINPDGTLKEQK